MMSLPLKIYSTDQDVRRASAGSTVNRRTAPYLLCIGYFAVFCGYNLWIASFHNYAVETFHISALHVGYMFSAAALPGTFAFLIGMLAGKFSLSNLMTFACGAMGFGLIGIGLAPSSYFLWPGVLSIGLGFSCFYPIINSICIQHSDPRTVSAAVGHLKSYGPLAAVTAFILITTCLPRLGYQSFFVISGGFVVLIGFWALTDLHIKPYVDSPGNLRFKKDLWPYYVLNFLAGCRSAGIKAFVLLLLIREHGLLLHETAAVFLIGNICSLIGYRLIGHFANRYNPPKVLSFIYLGVSLIFLGFCFINSRSVLILLYFFDSLLFGVSVVTDSHLKRVSRAKDTIGSVACGLTLFHLGKTIFPLAGGILWSYFHQQATFLAVSLLAVLAVWVSKKLVIPQSDKL
jgi:predicted MFS family arabinose efflux permease